MQQDYDSVRSEKLHHLTTLNDSNFSIGEYRKFDGFSYLS